MLNIDRCVLPSLAVLLIAWAGCSADEPQSNRIFIRSGNDTAITYEGETVARTQFALTSLNGTLVTTGMGLDLLSTVDSPRVGDTVLQATDVVWVGDHVFAAYNVRGPTFLGALQVLDVASPEHPKVLAEAIYPNTDLARILVAGDKIFAAGADPTYGGTLEVFRLHDSELTFEMFEPVGSYSATFLAIHDYDAYVAFGDIGGGVGVFDLANGVPALEHTVSLTDARWVDPLPNQGMLAVAGSPGRLVRYDSPSGEESQVRYVQGATVGAPTWALRREDRLFLCSDDAGLLVYDTKTLDLLGQLPTTGTANGLGLAGDGRLAFLCNGEEGLVVADVVDPAHPTALASLDVAGDQGSANAVAVMGEHMALADGLAGVKLLHFERTSGTVGDCDGDGVSDDVDTDDDDDGVLDIDDAAPCNPDVVCPEGTLDYSGEFIGDLYNLPCDHPDVEGPVTGVTKGTLPSDFDWFDQKYYAFTVKRDSLLINYGENYFPVDQGLCGDPFYFSAHWYTTALATEAGTYRVEMGSDDDSWLFVDGALVLDLGGIHAIKREKADIDLSAGPHSIDIYFAERHVVQSGLEFAVTGFPSGTASLWFAHHVCLAPEGDEDGDGVSNAEDLAPLHPH